MNLRVDPWDTEYGGSVPVEPDLAPPPALELQVESAGLWAPVAPPPASAGACCAFVDGVRRIDVRLFAEEPSTGQAGPALAGSWAVGSAWSTIPPRIHHVHVGRELVIGGGMSPEALKLLIGEGEVVFDARSVSGDTPADPVLGLQNAMRSMEAGLAEELLRAGDADLVVSDGPLTHYAVGPAVGLIKRQVRAFLDPERARILGRLVVGERTPIFKFGERRNERYSWYLRLATPRPIDGAMAGLVRLECLPLAGLDGARHLAELTAQVLPAFAPTPGRDPRAPQNLYPIGALEATLRHRLGDAVLIRRALETAINAEVLSGR